MGGLPALINEVNGQGADDEDTQAGDEHVVDGAEMLHLHQLTGGTGAQMSVWEVLKVMQTSSGSVDLCGWGLEIENFQLRAGTSVPGPRHVSFWWPFFHSHTQGKWGN